MIDHDAVARALDDGTKHSAQERRAAKVVRDLLASIGRPEVQVMASSERVRVRIQSGRKPEWMARASAHLTVDGRGLGAVQAAGLEAGVKVYSVKMYDLETGRPNDTWTVDLSRAEY